MSLFFLAFGIATLSFVQFASYTVLVQSAKHNLITALKVVIKFKNFESVIIWLHFEFYEFITKHAEKKH